jgi:hypothetical protein
LQVWCLRVQYSQILRMITLIFTNFDNYISEKEVF